MADIFDYLGQGDCAYLLNSVTLHTFDEEEDEVNKPKKMSGDKEMTPLMAYLDYYKKGGVRIKQETLLPIVKVLLVSGADVDKRILFDKKTLLDFLPAYSENLPVLQLINQHITNTKIAFYLKQDVSDLLKEPPLGLQIMIKLFNEFLEQPYKHSEFNIVLDTYNDDAVKLLLRYALISKDDELFLNLLDVFIPRVRRDITITDELNSYKLNNNNADVGLIDLGLLRMLYQHSAKEKDKSIEFIETAKKMSINPNDSAIVTQAKIKLFSNMQQQTFISPREFYNICYSVAKENLMKNKQADIESNAFMNYVIKQSLSFQGAKSDLNVDGSLMEYFLENNEKVHDVLLKFENHSKLFDSIVPILNKSPRLINKVFNYLLGNDLTLLLRMYDDILGAGNLSETQHGKLNFLAENFGRVIDKIYKISSYKIGSINKSQIDPLVKLLNAHNKSIEYKHVIPYLGSSNTDKIGLIETLLKTWQD